MAEMFICTYINSTVVIVENAGAAKRVRSHFFCKKEFVRNLFNSLSAVDFEGNKTPGETTSKFFTALFIAFLPQTGSTVTLCVLHCAS